MTQDASTTFNEHVVGLKNFDYDTWLVNAKLLALGHGTTLLPGGVVFSETAGTAPLAFVGTGSESTTFGGMAISRKTTAAWTLLEQAGLPVPEWKGFHVTAPKSAARYAERIGYPVVVSGAKGQSSTTANSEEDLRAGINQIAEGPKPHRTVVRNKLLGVVLKILLLEDETLAAAVQNVDGSWNSVNVENLAYDVLELAHRALSAVPGLGYGEIVLELEDFTRSINHQRVQVARVDFAPRLRGYGETAVSLHSHIVDAVVRYHADSIGVDVGSERTELNVAFQCSGLVGSRGFHGVFAPLADSIACEEVSEPVFPTDEGMSVTLRGTPKNLALLASLALKGIRPQHRAHMVTILMS